MTSKSFAEGIKNFFNSTKEGNKELTKTERSTFPVNDEPKPPASSDTTSSDVYISLNSNQCQLNLGCTGSIFNSSVIKIEPSDEIIVLDSDSNTEMPANTTEPSQPQASAIQTSESVTPIISNSIITTRSECDTTTPVDDDDDIIIVDSDNSEFCENVVLYPTIKDSPSLNSEISTYVKQEIVSLQIPETVRLIQNRNFESNSQAECVLSPAVMTKDVTFTDNIVSNSEQLECMTPAQIESDRVAFADDSEPAGAYPVAEQVYYYPNEDESEYAPYLKTEDPDSALPVHSIFEPDINLEESGDGVKIDEEYCNQTETADFCDKCAGKQVLSEVTSNDQQNTCSCNSSSLVNNVQVSIETDSNVVLGNGDENSNQVCVFCKKEIRGNMQYHCEFRCPAKETWRLLCNMCTDSFGSPSGLVNHAKVVHNIKITVDDALQCERVKNSPSSKEKESNVCPYCKKDQRYKQALRDHCEFHCAETETYRLVCKICSEGKSGPTSLVVHYRRVHKLEITHKMANNFERMKTSECLQTPRGSKENKTCTFCMKNFCSINEFNDHCDYQCSKRDTFKLICHICSNPYTGPSNLQLHLDRAHKIKTDRSFILSVSKKIRSDEINLQEEYRPKPTKPLFCVHCNKEFSSHEKKRLQIHTDFLCPSNKETFALVCEVCSDSFAGPYCLKYHMFKAHKMSISPSRAACAEKIKAKIKSAGPLQMTSKMPDNSQKSDISDSHIQSKNIDSVKSVIPVGTEDSQRVNDSVDIPNCTRDSATEENSEEKNEVSFNQPISGNLTKHQPFKNKSTVQNLRAAKSSSCVCQICGIYVYSSSFLKIHMRTHTNEKPFNCRKCGRGFIRKIAMKYHEIVNCPKRKSLRERTDSYEKRFQTVVPKHMQNGRRFLKNAAFKNEDHPSTDESDTDSESPSEETHVQSNSRNFSRKLVSKRPRKNCYDNKIYGRESRKETFPNEKRLKIRHSNENCILSNTKLSNNSHEGYGKLSHYRYSNKSDLSSSDESDNKMSCNSSNEETDCQAKKLYSRKKGKSTAEKQEKFRNQKNIPHKNRRSNDIVTSENCDSSQSSDESRDEMSYDRTDDEINSQLAKSISHKTKRKFSSTSRTAEKPKHFRSSSRKYIPDKNRKRSYGKVTSEKRIYSSSDDDDTKMSCYNSNDEINNQSAKSYSHRGNKKSSETTSFSSKFIGNKRFSNDEFSEYSRNIRVSGSNSSRNAFTLKKKKQFIPSSRESVETNMVAGENVLEKRSGKKAVLQNRDYSSTDEGDNGLSTDNFEEDKSCKSIAKLESHKSNPKSHSKFNNLARKFHRNKHFLNKLETDSYITKDSETNSEEEELIEKRQQKRYRSSNNQASNSTRKMLPNQQSRRPYIKPVLENSDCSSTDGSDKELVINSTNDDESSKSTTTRNCFRKGRKSRSKSSSLSRKYAGNKRSIDELKKDSYKTSDSEGNSEKEELIVERQKKYRRLNNQVDTFKSKTLPDQQSRRSSTEPVLRSSDDESTNENDNSTRKKSPDQKSRRSSNKLSLKSSDDVSTDENENYFGKKLRNQKSRIISRNSALKSSDDTSTEENDNSTNIELPDQNSRRSSSKLVFKSSDDVSTGENDNSTSKKLPDEKSRRSSSKTSLKCSDELSADENDNSTCKKLPAQESGKYTAKLALKNGDDLSTNENDNSRSNKLPDQKSRRSSSKPSLKSSDDSSGEENDIFASKKLPDQRSRRSPNKPALKNSDDVSTDENDNYSGKKLPDEKSRRSSSIPELKRSDDVSNEKDDNCTSKELLEQKSRRSSNKLPRKKSDDIHTNEKYNSSGKKLPSQKSRRSSNKLILKSSDDESAAENDNSTRKKFPDQKSRRSSNKPVLTSSEDESTNENDNSTRKKLPDQKSRRTSTEPVLKNSDDVSTEENDSCTSEELLDQKSKRSSNKLPLKKSDDVHTNEKDNSSGKKLPNQKSRRSSNKLLLKSSDDESTVENDNSKGKNLPDQESRRFTDKPALKNSDDLSTNENDNYTCEKLPDQKPRKSSKPELESSDDLSIDESNNSSKTSPDQKSKTPPGKYALKISDDSSISENANKVVSDSSHEKTSSQSRAKLESRRKNRKSVSDAASLSGKSVENEPSSKTNYSEDESSNTKDSEESKGSLTEENQKQFRRSSRKSVQTDKFMPTIIRTKNLPGRKVKRSCTENSGLYKECSSNESDHEISPAGNNEQVKNHSEENHSNPEAHSLKKSLPVNNTVRNVIPVDRIERSSSSSKNDSPKENGNINSEKSGMLNSQYGKTSEEQDLSSQDNKKSDELESAKINLKCQQFAIMCGICNMESRWLSAMKTHSLRLHNKFYIICKTCNGRFSDYSELRDHLKLNGRSYYCDKDPNNRKITEVIVISDDSDDDDNSKNISKCEVCSKKFPVVTDLFRHLEQHLTEA